MFSQVSIIGINFGLWIKLYPPRKFEKCINVKQCWIITKCNSTFGTFNIVGSCVMYYNIFFNHFKNIFYFILINYNLISS